MNSNYTPLVFQHIKFLSLITIKSQKALQRKKDTHCNQKCHFVQSCTQHSQSNKLKNTAVAQYEL